MKRLPVIASSLCMIATASGPWLAQQASAAPIATIGPVIDNPTSFRARFGYLGGGAGFGGGLFPHSIGGVNWITRFNVAEVNGGFGVHDHVTIVGDLAPDTAEAVLHLTHPHSGDMPPAPRLELSITFDATGALLGQNILVDGDVHPMSHFDETSWLRRAIATAARGGGDPGLDILAWTIGVRAAHIPEPSMLLLFGIGATGLLACAARRARTAA